MTPEAPTQNWTSCVNPSCFQPETTKDEGFYYACNKMFLFAFSGCTKKNTSQIDSMFCGIESQNYINLPKQLVLTQFPLF